MTGMMIELSTRLTNAVGHWPVSNTDHCVIHHVKTAVFYLIFTHPTIDTVTYTVDGYDERITQPAFRETKIVA